MLLVRYNADGALDAGFGTDGTMTFSMMAPTANEGLDIIANQGDGKFLVGGKSNQMYTEWDFTITRHNADGSLDTTFGKDGWVTTDFSPDHDQTHTFFLVSRDYLTAIAVQPDGKILAVGWSMLNYYGYYEKTAVVLARYLPDGSLDDSFGVGGRVLRYIENLYSVNDIAVQPDGKIVAVGSVEDEFLLIRFSPDGSPDETFGNSGIVLSNFFMGPWPNYEEANAVVLQSDGKILVAGYVWVLLSPTDMDRWTLARYNPDGSLDMSFGQGGVVGTFLKPYAYDLALQPDGKILVTGGSKDGYAPPTGEDFTLLRYLPDGSLDSTFGTEGMVFTDFGTETFGWSRNETAKSVALQPDGRIVVAGQVVEFLEPPDGDPINAIPNNNFGLVRYNPDGSLDYTFGDSGKVMTEFGSRQEGAEAVTIQNDGKILVVGSSSQRFRGKDMEIAIARYDAIGPVTIADIQEFFGTVVENGYLYGEGGVMCDAECSLARMSQLLESAAWYIERDRHLLACSALRRAHRRSDGESDRILTRDLVNGEAREWLAAMIERLMNDLGCRLF
jgi:uncharacterized delta-60 repeat protein